MEVVIQVSQADFRIAHPKQTKPPVVGEQVGPLKAHSWAQYHLSQKLGGENELMTVPTPAENPVQGFVLKIDSLQKMNFQGNQSYPSFFIGFTGNQNCPDTFHR